MAKDKDSIPAWQRVASAKPDEHSEGPEPSSTTTTEDMLFTREIEEMPQTPTREQAAKFLEHPATKSATLEDKIRFLEVKGVRQEDIEALIPEAKPKPTASVPASQTSSSTPSSQDSTPADSRSGPPALRDVPPVITYPEFLVERKQPAPLITTNFILNTMYGTAGAAATMYALSKYVLGPMHEALSEARHDLFGHSAAKVADLNTRLLGVVTTVPALKGKKVVDNTDNVSVSSEESDPTELFHRDIGVQTSPPQSRRGSLSSSDSLSSPADVLATQENRLKALSMHVRDLEQSRASIGSKEQDVNAQLTSFSQYLNEMMYTSPYYGYKASAPAWSTTGVQDEFDKFKAEIRSVKGVMLSTRNFPRSAGN